MWGAITTLTALSPSHRPTPCLCPDHPLAHNFGGLILIRMCLGLCEGMRMTDLPEEFIYLIYFQGGLLPGIVRAELNANAQLLYPEIRFST
jgi:hypothetical protein